MASDKIDMAEDDMPFDDDEGSDDDDMGMGMGGGDGELPEGVTKEIVQEADGASWKKPKAGDEVTVHYVGTLEADGSEFDSSRGRGKPFVFTLGKGQVIKGWDLGVATMKKGEIAKFTLAPEFAYGEGGSPPKIPGSATLVFEVELISWASKDDLFGDEGVILTQVQEGTSWKTPKRGGEVLLSVKATAADGTVFQEKTDFEYVLGSESLGAISKACDKALTQMKRTEEVELKCTKEYAGDAHPDGATVSLTLQEIYDVKDVSFGRSGKVMKKQTKEGEGYETPKDGARVTLAVSAASDGAAPLPSFQAKELSFLLGNGEVCDALECAVVEMKRAERATLTISDPSLAEEQQLGMKGVKAEKVVLTVELRDFEKVKEQWNMSEEEKLEFGAARKEVGTALFKGGRLALALQRYKKVADMFNTISSYSEDNKAKAAALKLACDLNQAAVHLKLKAYADARTACSSVLKEEKSNVKAMYRRAQAELGLKNFQECIADCKRVVEVDPQNKEARVLLKQAQAHQKEEDKKAKGMFANMCKALGKGPIREPGKSSAVPGGDFMDQSDDEDDAAMEDAHAAMAQEEKAKEDSKVE